MELSTLICSLVLAVLPVAADIEYDAGLSTCVDVVDTALVDDVPPTLAAALAYKESKFNYDAVNPRSGALGPLQILKTWWCPEWRACRQNASRRACKSAAEACDLVGNGIRAMRTYLKMAKWDQYKAMCWYNRGEADSRCQKRGDYFATTVVDISDRIRGDLHCQCCRWQPAPQDAPDDDWQHYVENKVNRILTLRGIFTDTVSVN